MAEHALSAAREHPPEHAFTYEPALDGIRAVAVAAVLLYHGGIRAGRGGFLGVDVFFVLSGFLITRLLLRELESTGRIGLRSFYARRARRLLPAVLLLLAVLSVYAVVAAPAGQAARIRSDGLASLLYVQNWHLVATGQSYFSQFAAPSPLRHMWSLAIEEQWYLVWPVLLMAIMRVSRGRRGRICTAILLLAAASAVAMAVQYHPSSDPSRVYYGTDTRAQELLVGAALAVAWPLLTRYRNRWTAVALQVAGGIGGVFVLWMIYASNDASGALYTGGFALVALGSAALVAGATSPGPLRYVLSTPPLPALGRVSYGVYLWHWPIFLLLTPAKLGLGGGLLLFVARVLVTIVVAMLSYRFVELPVRTRRAAPSLTPTQRRVRRRVSTPRRAVWMPLAAALVGSSLALGGVSLARGPAATTVNERSIASSATRAAISGQPTRAVRQDQVRLLVAGDSVAFFLLYDGVPPEYRAGISLAGRPLIGCGIARGPIVSNGITRYQLPECDRWPQTYEEEARVANPDIAVLLVGAWEVYDRKVGGRLVRFGTPAMEAYIRSELDRAVAILSANGAPVVLLSAPCFHVEPADTIGWGSSERNSPVRIAWFDDLLRRYADEHATRVAYRDIRPILCPRGEYQNVIGGAATRLDGVHFTSAGATMVWRGILPDLESLGRASAPYQRREAAAGAAPPLSSFRGPLRAR